MTGVQDSAQAGAGPRGALRLLASAVAAVMTIAVTVVALPLRSSENGWLSLALAVWLLLPHGALIGIGWLARKRTVSLVLVTIAAAACGVLALWAYGWMRFGARDAQDALVLLFLPAAFWVVTLVSLAIAVVPRARA